LHGARFGPDTLYGNKLSENFYTLAEALSDRGYRTAAVIANHGYLNTTFGFSQGFEYYDDRSSGRISAGHKHYLRTLIGDAVCNTISLLECEVYYRNAAEITKEATRLLQQLKQEGATPFFLFLNFMDAHAPYNPPAPFDTLFPGKSAAFTREHNAMLIRDVNSLRRSITDAERDHLISQYDGGIAFIDQQLGILVARLRELDIYKNTILVITSDHGEAFGDRNLMEHGVSVYQDQVHVPLIIKYPGSLVKGRFEDVVSTADILPTVLTLLGLSVPKNLQGLPLNGIATNYGDERPVLSETNATAELRRWHKRFDRVQHALVRGRWKFIKSGAKQELYDIHTDPHESRNLCSNLGESCNKFDDELESWLARVSTPAVAPPKLNNADMERLKSLGYVQ
jgi:arylsulfatase A-like enzyme